MHGTRYSLISAPGLPKFFNLHCAPLSGSNVLTRFLTDVRQIFVVTGAGGIVGDRENSVTISYVSSV